MSHDYKTRAKKDTEQNVLAKLEQTIIKGICGAKDQVLNLKDIVMKNVQEGNTRRYAKWNYLEKKAVSLETKLNHLDQYARRNNLVLPDIPGTVENKHLESTVSSILSDTDVTIGPHDVEAYCRTGLSGKNKSKKTIIRLVICRYAKKALINRTKLDSIENAKYNLDGRTKIFVNENLSFANESLAYNCRKLRWAKITDSCYFSDGIICIKYAINSKPEKIHHMKELQYLFPDSVFSNDEESILDAKHDVVNVSNNFGTV